MRRETVAFLVAEVANERVPALAPASISTTSGQISPVISQHSGCEHVDLCWLVQKMAEMDDIMEVCLQ